MSFNFTFSVTDEGELYLTESAVGQLLSAIEGGHVPVGVPITVSGHKPSSHEDWGSSLSLHIPGLGRATMESVFLRPASKETDSDSKDE